VPTARAPEPQAGDPGRVAIAVPPSLPSASEETVLVLDRPKLRPTVTRAPGAAGDAPSAAPGPPPSLPPESSGGRDPAPPPAFEAPLATMLAPPQQQPMILRLLDVVDRVRAAKDRDGVVQPVLDLLATAYRRNAFFMVKQGVVTSREARGDVQSEALRSLAFPLDTPSLLRDVVSERMPYRGPLWPSPVNNLLAVALGGTPAEIILVPVYIHERVIGVLYADTPTELMPDGVLDRLAFEMGTAYERILRSAK
jgi:hypothetical protein